MSNMCMKDTIFPIITTFMRLLPCNLRQIVEDLRLSII